MDTTTKWTNCWPHYKHYGISWKNFRGNKILPVAIRSCRFQTLKLRENIMFKEPYIGLKRPWILRPHLRTPFHVRQSSLHLDLHLFVQLYFTQYLVRLTFLHFWSGKIIGKLLWQCTTNPISLISTLINPVLGVKYSEYKGAGILLCTARSLQSFLGAGFQHFTTEDESFTLD